MYISFIYYYIIVYTSMTKSRWKSQGKSQWRRQGLSRELSQTRIYASIYMFIFCIYQYIIVYTIYDYFIPCYCLWWYGSLALRLSVVDAGTYWNAYFHHGLSCFIRTPPLCRLSKRSVIKGAMLYDNNWYTIA